MLIEHESGLILVDTGLGLNDVAEPRTRLGAFLRALAAPELREEMTAVRQIAALGFDPLDVRHIVLTHLDFDHAGGLDDFPGARVHLLQGEYDRAVAQRSWLDRQRYRPAQWSTQNHWLTYESGEGEPWFGFDCVRHLAGVPDDVLLVPLLGHTFGHCGVAVKDDDRWQLLAGDAYFFHRELDVTPYCPWGLRLYQSLLEKDHSARSWNQERLRQLKTDHGREIEIFSSHDVIEFERVSCRSTERPALPLLTEPQYERPGIIIAPH
jgi:glyoxylase-like metal-dependent hydrolase (beta-lactamase superfamily II)